MDGHYRNKEKQYIVFLQSWIDKVILEKLWLKYIDLHITDVGEEFKDKKNWLSGSLFLHNCISKLINKSEYQVTLAIPLTCVHKKTDINIISLNNLENELDLTPPSFYLFPLNSGNMERTIKSSTYLKEISSLLKVNAYIKEEKEDVVYRTIYIQGG